MILEGFTLRQIISVKYEHTVISGDETCSHFFFFNIKLGKIEP
jgi:hypothetical protein